MSKQYFITTPIYYVNGVPHIGSATTTLICDAVARFQAMNGRRVFFLTGTDEHAKKVANAAQKAGKTPQQYVDEVSARFAETWAFLNIDNSRFIRTSEPDHKQTVTEVFRRLSGSGDIYKGLYEGWYSVSDETYYSDSDVVDGIATETGSTVERVTEENYYFRLSAFGDRLTHLIESEPDFLMPDTRRNEVIAFIQGGLRDVPVSRRNAGWGIPVPGDDSQTVYVWFDALINYLSATGWPDSAGWTELWPADAHLVGKEIYTRFHATLWPAMLMGLGIAPPRHVVGHGWWLIQGEKGSKSRGNIPTPQEVVAALESMSGAQHDIAVDALRYCLLRDISLSTDVEFAMNSVVARYNGELANDLGNLLNRSLNMLWQYRNGVVPDAAEATTQSTAAAAARAAGASVAEFLEGFNCSPALEAISRFVSVNNKALDTAAPWKRHKEGDEAAVSSALYAALESLRIVSVLVAPFMPAASRAFRRQLGIDEQVKASFDLETQWGGLTAGTTVGVAEPLFPRIDRKALSPQPASDKPPKPLKKDVPTMAPETSPDQPGLVTIQDFARVQLRVAQIVAAEPVENATKLLRLTVDVGEETQRQIVAGIAESYSPELLVGKHIVVVANLQPATIRGVQSNGMLLAATDEDGKAVLLSPDASRPLSPGAKIR